MTGGNNTISPDRPRQLALTTSLQQGEPIVATLDNTLPLLHVFNNAGYSSSTVLVGPPTVIPPDSVAIAHSGSTAHLCTMHPIGIANPNGTIM